MFKYSPPKTISVKKAELSNLIAWIGLIVGNLIALYFKSYNISMFSTGFGFGAMLRAYCILHKAVSKIGY